jgi:hypothetical protein
MLTGWELGAAFVLPAAVTALLVVAGWRLVHHHYSARASRTWAGPAAVGAGVAAGWLAQFGWTGLPPHDVVDWLLPLTIPLVVAGTFDALGWVPPPARVLAIALAVPFSFLLIAWPALTNSGGAGLPWELLAAVALAMVPLVSLDALVGQISTARYAAVMLACAGPAAVVLTGSGSARLGLIGVILASAMFGLLGASVPLGRAGRARGVTLVCGTLLAGLLWSGYLYASLRPLDAVLLAVAPCLAWVGPFVPRRWGWLVHVAGQLGVVLAASGSAALRAWLELRDSGL